jgi:hypothetical protein
MLRLAGPSTFGRSQEKLLYDSRYSSLFTSATKWVRRCGVFSVLRELCLGRGRSAQHVGRPLTPMSYAGVARRTTRRAVAVGAAGAAAAGAYYYSAPGCVQVVNSYGQIVQRCP